MDAINKRVSRDEGINDSMEKLNSMILELDEQDRLRNNDLSERLKVYLNLDYKKKKNFPSNDFKTFITQFPQYSFN